MNIDLTMLHEMVHLHNLQFDIKDVSRGGTYHNKKFKKIAEQKGLIIEYDKKIGWSLTTLQESTEVMIQQLKPCTDLFKVARRGPVIISDDADNEDGEEEKPKSSMRKYVCPSCGTIVRATKEVNIVCGDCQETFVVEE